MENSKLVDDKRIPPRNLNLKKSRGLDQKKITPIFNAQNRFVMEKVMFFLFWLPFQAIGGAVETDLDRKSVKIVNFKFLP